MKAYKLTDKQFMTRNSTKWGEGVTHKVGGTDASLCSSSWLHFYTHPLLAVLMNPRHANIIEPVLWEAEAGGEILNEPLKSGSKELTTVRQIPLPVFTCTNKTAFAILCAMEVYKGAAWTKWAEGWLNGSDRSRAAAADAYAADAAAVYAAADAYAAAVYAAADAYAAYAYAYAADAANAAADAYAADAYAADAAAYAAAYAYADAAAVYAAARRGLTAIDFAAIAEKAMLVK